MFYVYGKFRTISMNIKEVTTPLAILDYFLPGVKSQNDFEAASLKKFPLKGKLRPVNYAKRWEKRARFTFLAFFKHLLRLNLLFSFLILVKIQY